VSVSTTTHLPLSCYLQNERSVPGAKYQQAERLWTDGNYKGFLTLAAGIAKEVLPNTYPEWQKTSASYGQVKHPINPIENAT
jgi:hypothetical protein